MNHKKTEFFRLAVIAANHLTGDCPLIEDEAIVWANERINKLEALLISTTNKPPNHDWAKERDSLLKD